MDFNLNGIVNKISSKADLITFLASSWEAIPTYGGHSYRGIGGLIGWFLQVDMSKGGALNELKNTLTFPGLIEEKLRSNHLYAAGIKYGAIAYILQELGFFTKYRAATEKVLTASVIALAVLPGSGPYPSNGSASKGAGGRIQGY